MTPLYSEVKPYSVFSFYIWLLPKWRKINNSTPTWANSVTQSAVDSRLLEHYNYTGSKKEEADLSFLYLLGLFLLTQWKSTEALRFKRQRQVWDHGGETVTDTQSCTQQGDGAVRNRCPEWQWDKKKAVLLLDWLLSRVSVRRPTGDETSRTGCQPNKPNKDRDSGAQQATMSPTSFHHLSTLQQSVHPENVKINYYVCFIFGQC